MAASHRIETQNTNEDLVQQFVFSVTSIRVFFFHQQNFITYGKQDSSLVYPISTTSAKINI